MPANPRAPWKWIWPAVGPTPITEGLDSEIFDRADFPYSEAFVREALQNSLDARLASASAVRVHFTFHSTRLQPLLSVLQDVISYRKKISLPIPQTWSTGEISWLVVQDFHATGLSGNLNKRTSDYWNYWLNFGQSNKDGSGRGGRGIGRVTFLIASSIQTVIGYTRRRSDHRTPICGMTVLRPVEDHDKFLSSHAYLASSERKSIYNLHNSQEFNRAVIKGFQFADYTEKSDTGLALAIPYPHEKLNKDRILAAAIEHFSPTIMENKLVLDIEDTRLNRETIRSVSNDIYDCFRDASIKRDPMRFLGLIRHAQKQHESHYTFRLPNTHSKIPDLKHDPATTKVKRRLNSNSHCVLDLYLPLKHEGEVRTTKVRAVIANTPDGALPIDCFFRNGMRLPKVKAPDAGDLDLLLFVEDELLATYLNLCEGKAHLDLSRSKEITQKLRSNSFGPPVYGLRDIIKSLPKDLRQLFCDDASQPDARVFETFFSLPAPPKKPPVDSGKPDLPDSPPTSQIKPVKISIFKKDGFRIKAVKAYSKWPVDLSLTIAYADGTRRPKWNVADFDLTKLTKGWEGCDKLVIQDNEIICRHCESQFRLEIRGFDPKRELSIVWR